MNDNIRKISEAYLAMRNSSSSLNEAKRVKNPKRLQILNKGLDSLIDLIDENEELLRDLKQELQHSKDSDGYNSDYRSVNEIKNDINDVEEWIDELEDKLKRVRAKRDKESKLVEQVLEEETEKSKASKIDKARKRVAMLTTMLANKKAKSGGTMNYKGRLAIQQVAHELEMAKNHLNSLTSSSK